MKIIETNIGIKNNFYIKQLRKLKKKLHDSTNKIPINNAIHYYSMNYRNFLTSKFSNINNNNVILVFKTNYDSTKFVDNKNKQLTKVYEKYE